MDSILVERKPVAITAEEADLHGCPHCGFRTGRQIASDEKSSSVVCGDNQCHRSYVVVSAPLTRSTIRLGQIYPEVVPHPRLGIPKHGRPDHRPEGGGEYFHCDGISYDTTPGCFVCGEAEKVHRHIIGRVQCREAAQRILGMFTFGARLHSPPNEPDNVQVRVGACQPHEANLDGLQELVSDGVITKGMVTTAIIAV